MTKTEADAAYSYAFKLERLASSLAGERGPRAAGNWRRARRAYLVAADAYEEADYPEEAAMCREDKVRLCTTAASSLAHRAKARRRGRR